MCKTWIKIVYIYRGIWCHTRRAWRRCVAQIHEWMFRDEVNFSGFPCSGSREQWTLCREHVNRNTVHAWSALLTSWLSESGVLTKRDRQNMQSGGGARTGIENLCFKWTMYKLLANYLSDFPFKVKLNWIKHSMLSSTFKSWFKLMLFAVR